jgi:hypothetical protein
MERYQYLKINNTEFQNKIMEFSIIVQLTTYKKVLL